MSGSYLTGNSYIIDCCYDVIAGDLIRTSKDVQDDSARMHVLASQLWESWSLEDLGPGLVHVSTGEYVSLVSSPCGE